MAVPSKTETLFDLAVVPGPSSPRRLAGQADQGAVAAGTATVHQLKVTLSQVRPPVWRRLQVPSTMDLGMLSDVLQIAFGRGGDHLHQFEQHGVRFEPAQFASSSLLSLRVRSRDENATTVSSFGGAGAVAEYTYDFGDDWRHRIEVEDVVLTQPAAWYPVCVAGRGQAPEEDTRHERPDRFDQDSLNRRLASAFGVRGRDLDAGDDALDAVLGGLFASMMPGAQCPCGEPHHEGQMTFRPYRAADPAALADEAGRSSLLRQALQLAGWLGDGRPLTASRVLRPTDGMAAAAQVGCEPQHAQPVSSKDLVDLHPVWSAAVSAGLISIQGARALPGPGVQLWPGGDPLERLDCWARAVAGYVRARVESDRKDWNPFRPPLEDVLAATTETFFELGLSPVPAALPALMILGDQADDRSTTAELGTALLSLLPGVVSESVTMWTRAGILVNANETVDPDAADHFAKLVDATRSRTEGESLLPSLLDSVKDQGFVALTPLGEYGFMRLLRAHGRTVPMPGDLADLSPAEFLDAVDAYEPRDTIGEALVWLSSHPDGVAAGVHELGRLASTKYPIGPGRRQSFLCALTAACVSESDPDAVEALLDAFVAHPWLQVPAALVRHGLERGPAPSMQQYVWLAIDALSAQLEVPERHEAAAASELADLVRTPAGLEAALVISRPDAELPHPHGDAVLRLLGEALSDPLLSAQIHAVTGRPRAQRTARRSRRARRTAIR